MKKKENFINFNKLKKIDFFFSKKNTRKLDQEIEYIIDKIFVNLHKEKYFFKCLLAPYLETRLLRNLYVTFFSFRNLKKKYKKIIIKNSHTSLDIILSHYKLKVPKNRINHDNDFYISRRYVFERIGLYSKIKKRIKSFYFLLKNNFKINVLYLNAGKLNKDFQSIQYSYPADLISKKNNNDTKIFDSKKIINQINKNINNLNISIPKNILKKLIEKKIYIFLPEMLKQIELYYNFIKNNKIQLVIISASTHEDHISLFLASKMAGIKNLIIPHGFTGLKNNYLNNEIMYSATISKFEYNYKCLKNFKLKMDWFKS